MSLEFTVQYGCKLRAQFTEGQLRHWGRLGNIHAQITREQATPSDDAFNFVETSREEIELMQTATLVCAKCPAQLPVELAGPWESVGCQGRIIYPIEGRFEKFVANRLQLMLDTVPLEEQPRLVRILLDSDSPFDGDGTKVLRAVTTSEGLRFFALRLPINLTRAGSRLTTDHVFDALAGFTSEDAGTTTYTRELPPAALGDYYDFLELLLRQELSVSEIERLARGGRTYSQFLRLLTAVDRAEALGTRLLLD